jgi:hypothetical protein
MGFGKETRAENPDKAHWPAFRHIPADCAESARHAKGQMEEAPHKTKEQPINSRQSKVPGGRCACDFSPIMGL